jgi:hypothetical protein
MIRRRLIHAGGRGLNGQARLTDDRCYQPQLMDPSDQLRRPRRRRQQVPAIGPLPQTIYARDALIRLGTLLGVDQRGIDATGERADVVSQHLVGAVDHDCDGRQDERVFRHCLATRVANHRLTGADEQLRH